MAKDDTWKLPVGYVLINGMGGEQKAGLRLCIHKLERGWANVTFNGNATNFAMERTLGCTLEMPHLLEGGIL